MDVLTEMQEATVTAANPIDNPELYHTPAPDPRAAELALLQHLALEGQLAFERDQAQAAHQALTQRLAQAREQRQGLVEAVQAAGGKLPSWNL